MKLELFVSSSFAPCRGAERVWSAVAGEQKLDLAVVDINSRDGGVRATQLGIRVVPALVMDGRLLTVGVQTPEEVRTLLATARR